MTSRILLGGLAAVSVAAFAVIVSIVLLLVALIFGIPIGDAASPATVPADDLAAAGYVGDDPSEFTVERRVTLFDVSVTNWIATYRKGGPDGGGETPSTDDFESTADEIETATLVVLSTPDASVAGRSLNPLVRLSDGQLVATILERLDGFDDVEVENVREVDAEQRRILDDEVTVRTYAAEGGDASLRVHLAIVEHEDDVVVLVGTHPEGMDERTTLLSLMETVDHSS